MSTALATLTSQLASRFNLGDGAELMATLKATAFKGPVTDAQMSALLIVANQYGLNPWTKEIYAFPDKNNGIVPVVGVDGWSRIINNHPQFDGMEFRSSEVMVTPKGGKPCPEWMECVIYRKDRANPVVTREYLDEVYREPFTKRGDRGEYTVDGPWQSHTKRFLRHKTMIQGSRLAFGYGGIYDHDEAERIAEKDITPQTVAHEQAKAGVADDPRREELIAAAEAIANCGDVDVLRAHIKALSADDRKIIGTVEMTRLGDVAKNAGAIDGEFERA